MTLAAALAVVAALALASLIRDAMIVLRSGRPMPPASWYLAPDRPNE